MVISKKFCGESRRHLTGACCSRITAKRIIIQNILDCHDSELIRFEYKRHTFLYGETVTTKCWWEAVCDDYDVCYTVEQIQFTGG